MRMWMIDPRWMCDQHLLGEHVECHMLVGVINKNKSVQGYINNGLVELDKLRERHDELVTELVRRNMNHKSPLPKPEKILAEFGRVNRIKNAADLMCRCQECRERFRRAIT